MPYTGTRRALLGGGARAPWWLAGEVPLANAVAIYKPIGAASLAESYINLANPGTYNAAPGTAPTFAAATGWTFDAASSQYLTTGIVPGAMWTMIVRFSGLSATAADQYAAGVVDTSADFRYHLVPMRSSDYAQYGNGNASTGVRATVPRVASGVLAVAGANCYRAGVADGAITQGTYGATALGIFIGGRNFNGSMTLPMSGNILAVAIYNTTLSGAAVAAISAAMAAL